MKPYNTKIEQDNTIGEQPFFKEGAGGGYVFPEEHFVAKFYSKTKIT